MKLDPEVYIKAINKLSTEEFSCIAIKRCSGYYAEDFRDNGSRVYVEEYEAVYRPLDYDGDAWLVDSPKYEDEDVRVLMLLFMAEIAEDGGL